MVAFLGKALHLASRTVACHTQAVLQLWVGWMRLALGDGGGQHLHSYLGLLNSHVRPRRLGCPFGARAWCWLRWGRTVDGKQQPSQGLPIRLLNGLATLAALAAEPWAAPSRKAWPHISAFGFGTEPCLTASSVWVGDLLVWMGPGMRGGGRLVH